jgi:hypothetical protein
VRGYATLCIALVYLVLPINVNVIVVGWTIAHYHESVLFVHKIMKSVLFVHNIMESVLFVEEMGVLK